MGEASRQLARGRTSSAAQFSAGVEVSLNCYHADLESFLQLLGSDSRFAHSAEKKKKKKKRKRKPENLVINAPGLTCASAPSKRMKLQI